MLSRLSCQTYGTQCHFRSRCYCAVAALSLPLIAVADIRCYADKANIVTWVAFLNRGLLYNACYTPWLLDNHTSRIRNAYGLAQSPTEVTIQWIPSHVGIPGNDSADVLANAAL